MRLPGNAGIDPPVQNPLRRRPVPGADVARHRLQCAQQHRRIIAEAHARQQVRDHVGRQDEIGQRADQDRPDPARRGRIAGTQTGRRGMMAISAQVPLAELEGYESQLKSMTGGHGSYDIEFSHYDPVPPDIQKRLADAHARGE